MEVMRVKGLQDLTQRSSIKQFDDYVIRIKNIIKVIVTICVIVVMLGIGVCLGYFGSIISKERSIDDTSLLIEMTTFPGSDSLDIQQHHIIDAYNQPYPLLIAGPAEVSPFVSKAIIASEDAQFESHAGILPKAILRAMYQDIFNHTGATGGSTITQQLVKNQLLTSDKTYDRKAKEIMYALRVEKLLSKEEIMYTYLNIVPFGYNHYGEHVTGITSASYNIFGKSPKSLNLAESAYLAGLIQSPYYFTPYEKDGQKKDAEALQPSIQKQQYVLKRMLIENQITKKQYQNALKIDIFKYLI